MTKSRDLPVRGFEFTVAIVHFCRSVLFQDLILRRLLYQLVDAAGSVGANLEESGAGQTKPDFITKQCTALKEARESRCWLRVIETTYPSVAAATKPHIEEASELIAMLTSSIKTVKSTPHRGEPRRETDAEH
jgi:four helix bundle protein